MRYARIMQYGILSAASTLVALPLLLVLCTSLKPLAEINQNTLFDMPKAPTLNAWAEAWGRTCIGGNCSGLSAGFINSAEIVLPALILSVAAGALAGYALSVRASRGYSLVLVALMSGLFLPIQMTLFPMIWAERVLGIFGTISGVVVVHTLWGFPFLTLLFRNACLRIPVDMLRAAQVDGAGFFAIFWYLILPLSAPACAVAFTLQFTYLWNEFLLNLIFAGTGHESVTVSLNLLAGAQYGAPHYNVVMAAAIIAAIPTIALYLLSGPMFSRGIMASGMKG